MSNNHLECLVWPTQKKQGNYQKKFSFFSHFSEKNSCVYICRGTKENLFLIFSKSNYLLLDTQVSLFGNVMQKTFVHPNYDKHNHPVCRYKNESKSFDTVSLYNPINIYKKKVFKVLSQQKRFV